jgi:hypothetical protein
LLIIDVDLDVDWVNVEALVAHPEMERNWFCGFGQLIAGDRVTFDACRIGVSGRRTPNARSVASGGRSQYGHDRDQTRQSHDYLDVNEELFVSVGYSMIHDWPQRMRASADQLISGDSAHIREPSRSAPTCALHRADQLSITA